MPFNEEPTPALPEYSYGAFDEAREEFGELPVVTRADFTGRILAAHHDLVGNAGHEAAAQFFTRVEQLHSNNEETATNYRKAGLRALEILEEASYLPQNQIDAFFDNQVTESYIAEVRAKRPAEQARMFHGINHAIGRRSEKYGPTYQGVVAAIVHGSYADGTLIPGSSDIDLALVTATANPGMAHEDQWIDYEEDAVAAITAQTNRPVDVSLKIPLVAPPRVLRLTSYPDSILYESNLLVISPHADAAERVQALLQQGQQEAAQARERQSSDPLALRPLGSIAVWLAPSGDQV